MNQYDKGSLEILVAVVGLILVLATYDWYRGYAGDK